MPKTATRGRCVAVLVFTDRWLVEAFANNPPIANLSVASAKDRYHFDKFKALLCEVGFGDVCLLSLESSLLAAFSQLKTVLISVPNLREKVSLAIAMEH